MRIIWFDVDLMHDHTGNFFTAGMCKRLEQAF